MKLYEVIPTPVYAWGYRMLSRLLHRLNLHYAPAKLMPDPDEPSGARIHRWCKWCGLRGSEPYWPPGTTLEQRLEKRP